MIGLYSLMALVLFGGAAFLLGVGKKEFYSGPDQEAPPDPDLNLLLQRLDDLDDLLARGEIDKVEFQQRQRVIEGALAPLLGVSSIGQGGYAKPTYSTAFGALVVIMPFLAVSGYFVSVKMVTTQPEPDPVSQSENRPDLPPMVLDMVGRLQTRLETHPADGEGWKKLARSYAVLGRNDEALAAYREAARLLPGDSSILTAYAEVLRKNAGITSSLESKPDQTESSQASAPASGSDQQKRAMAEMVARLEEKLQADPQNAQGWSLLGRSWLTLGDPYKALVAYRHAAELMPEDKELARVISLLDSSLQGSEGEVSSNEGGDGLSRMLVQLRKQAEANPLDAEGWYRLGTAHRLQNQWPVARDILRKAYQLAPLEEDYLLAYADADMRAEGKVTQVAKELVLEALKNQPDSIDALWLASYVFNGEGDIDAAIGFLQKAKALVSKTDERYAHIDSVLMQLKQAKAGASQSDQASGQEASE